MGVGVNRSADAGAGEAGRGGLQRFVVSYQLLHSLAELQRLRLRLFQKISCGPNPKTHRRCVTRANIPRMASADTRSHAENCVYTVRARPRGTQDRQTLHSDTIKPVQLHSTRPNKHTRTHARTN